MLREKKDGSEPMICCSCALTEEVPPLVNADIVVPNQNLMAKDFCTAELDEADQEALHEGFRMKFRTMSDEIVDVDFSDQEFPLGIIFKIPDTVDRVQAGSSADKLGVRDGWRLIKLNNIEVANIGFMELRRILA